VADFNEVIRGNTTYAEAYHERGRIMLRRKNFAQALADLNKALTLPPRPKSDGIFFGSTENLIYNERAEANRALGNIDAAILDYTEFATRSAHYLLPEIHAQTYAARGALYAQKGDIERALADYTEATSLSANNSDYRLERGRLLAKAGRLEQAIADLTKVIDLGLRDREGYQERAQVYEHKGDLKSAAADYHFLKREYGDKDAEAALARLERPAASVASASPRLDQPVAAPAALPSSERRIALVIGNSAYANTARLANPKADAELIAASLQNAGFSKVDLSLDLPRERLIDTLKAFAAEADKADWAVIYFAGHGLEIGGVNYLIPTDARLASDRDIPYEAIALEQVLHAVGGAKKLKLVVLDACRDNPFARSMTRSASATRSIGRGLAPVEDSGTLVAYAAKHGQVALDGDGTNSPFAVALARNIEVAGLEINMLLRKVRDDVLSATGKRQEPFQYGSLPSEAFYFRPVAAAR
jgi:tetratricopeptide (TPR) repeat protein